MLPTQCTEAAGPVPRDGGWAGCLLQTPLPAPLPTQRGGRPVAGSPFPLPKLPRGAQTPLCPPKTRPLQPHQTLCLAFQAPPDLATLGPASALGAGTKGEPPHPAPPRPPCTFCLGSIPGTLSVKENSIQPRVPGVAVVSCLLLSPRPRPASLCPSTEVLRGRPLPPPQVLTGEGWPGACRALSREPLTRVLPIQAARPHPMPSTAGLLGTAIQAPVTGTLGHGPAGLYTALLHQAGGGAWGRREEGGESRDLPAHPGVALQPPFPTLPDFPGLVSRKKQTFKDGLGTFQNGGPRGPGPESRRASRSGDDAATRPWREAQTPELEVLPCRAGDPGVATGRFIP